MKFFLCVFLLCVNSLFAEVGMPAIEQASRANNHLFLFFFKDQSPRTLRAQKVFDQSQQSLGDRALFAKVRVTDVSEKPIVEKFDLKRSPMPFVLVLAPNGAVTGGFPSTFTEQQLVNSFASPGMARCLKALQDKKLVFLCVQNEKTTGNAVALQGVKDFKADSRYASATEIIQIDPSDKEEKGFLQQLGVDTSSSQAATLFIAPPAQTIGNYKGVTSKERFVADLQKAVSGCCPGGCCPGGCCPGGKCGS